MEWKDEEREEVAVLREMLELTQYKTEVEIASLPDDKQKQRLALYAIKAKAIRKNRVKKKKGEEGDVMDLKSDIDLGTYVQATYDPYLQEFATDDQILRFLRAHGHKPEKAFKRLLTTVEWRIAFGVEQLNQNGELLPILRQRKMYQHGRDRQGRPVIYNRKSKDPSIDHLLDVKAVVYCLEQAIKSMSPETDGKWLWILDMALYSRSNSPPFAITKMTLGIFQDHYPERLFKAIVVDGPWIFHSLYWAISAFLDNVTKAKFIWCKQRLSQETQTKLLELVSKEELPPDFGGDLEPYRLIEHKQQDEQVEAAEAIAVVTSTEEREEGKEEAKKRQEHDAIVASVE